MQDLNATSWTTYHRCAKFKVRSTCIGVRFMRRGMLLATLVLWAVAFANIAQAECDVPRDCNQYWVAAQTRGVPLAYFSRVLPPAEASKIKVGDTVLSATDLN